MGTAILVVDDEQLIRWCLKERLEQDGYQVVEARSGQEALELMRDEVRLVLLDLRLPDTDGLSLLAELRRAHPDCRVILMTAHGSPGVTRDATAGGVFAVVDKPFSLDVMAHLAEEALHP